MTFTLHPTLSADTHLIGDLPRCRVLLMNNAHFPWLILVPRRMRSSSEAVAQEVYMRELFDLSPEDYTQTMQEIRMVAEKFAAHTQAHKMNVATLGNVVPQLHIHIIARFEHDAAWPNPVWNSGITPRPYNEAEKEDWILALRNITNL